MANLPLNLDECTVKITQEAHYEFPDRMSTLEVVARHPKLGQLAEMRCTIVSRRPPFQKYDDFYGMMDFESHELMVLSTTLFDERSNVKTFLIDDEYKRGSGCWGKELNEGQIVYFESLEVEEEYQGRGIGSLVLQHLFKASSFIKKKANIFCWPSPLPTRLTNESDADWRSRIDRINRFFHSNGFRRIGRTAFFAYSIDPTHPSRQLPIEDDPGLLGDEYPDISSFTIEQAKLLYPLHAAIDDKLPTITNIITAAYAANPAQIHQRDIVGYTPVHLAAFGRNVPALRTLLNLGVADDLRNTLNKDHMTPLEILQDKMHRTREMEEDTGKWDGHSEEMLVCEYLLKKALGMPLMATSEEEYAIKGRLGCTCGSCEDQWFSSNMSTRLFLATEVARDVMRMEFKKFTSSKPLSADAAKLLYTQFLPPSLRVKMYKSFYEGYCSIFDAISHILQDEADGIPTPARVLAKAHSVGDNVDYYIKNGGLVEYALNAIITMTGDPDDTFDYLDEDDYAGSRCANDTAFKLVRCKLGLQPIIYPGSYAG